MIPNPNPKNQILKLHQVYERLTGFKVHLTISRMDAWQSWMIYGPWTAEDLELVLISRRRKIQARHWGLDMLKFHNVVQRLEAFEEDLNEAKAMRRKPKFTAGKERVLRATGRRSEPEPIAARTPAQIMEADRAFAAFRQLKATL